MSSSLSLYLIIALAPLAGAILAGLFGTGFLGRQVSRRGSHLLTISLVAVSASSGRPNLKSVS
jgi:NADH-quinone oxidoreductase subunit L